MKSKTTKSRKTAGSCAKASPAKQKKTHYISFNEQELDKLRQLGFRERWAYMEIKGLSNWKTGSCGDFLYQRLSYVQIAALVTVPGTQGRGDGNIDDTQAADFLKHMVAVGLIANIGRRANGGLRFDLPLSPINRDKAAQSGEIGEIEVQASGKIADIFPAEDAPQIPPTPAPATVCEGSDPSLSVMINKIKNISNDEAGSAAAETAPPCRAIGAAPALENSHMQPSAAAPLTAREIHHAITDNWAFSETDTPEAWTLYASWAGAGITLEDLHAAMTSLEEDASGPALTPANLIAKLWVMVVDDWVDQLAV